MFRILISITFIVLLASCNGIPVDVQKVLQNTKNNRAELEAVISHYKELGGEEKLKTAYYLIGNMADKYYWDGEIVTAYVSMSVLRGSVARSDV